MRLLISLLALAAIAPAQTTQQPTWENDSFFFGGRKDGVAPDERRALIVGKALWQAGAGKDMAQAYVNFRVRKVGGAWLLTASVPQTSDEDPADRRAAFLAFDSMDGGFFMVTAMTPPQDAEILTALSARRTALGLPD